MCVCEAQLSDCLHVSEGWLELVWPVVCSTGLFSPGTRLAVSSESQSSVCGEETHAVDLFLWSPKGSLSNNQSVRLCSMFHSPHWCFHVSLLHIPLFLSFPFFFEVWGGGGGGGGGIISFLLSALSVLSFFCISPLIYSSFHNLSFFYQLLSFSLHFPPLLPFPILTP